MSSAPRSTLLFVGLLVLVLLASYLYSLWLGSDHNDSFVPDRSMAAAEPPAADLNPEFVAGRTALREGRVDDAIERFSAVPASDPSHMLALYNLAGALRVRGDDEATAETLVRLTRLAPENPNYRLSLARSYFRLSRFGPAEREAMRAIEIAPDMGIARFDVALFRLAQGRLPEAIDAYVRALTLPDATASITRARQDLSDLLVLRPDLPGPHYAMAYLSNAVGDRVREAAELQRFLAAEPSGPVSDRARDRLAETGQTGQP